MKLVVVLVVLSAFSIAEGLRTVRRVQPPQLSRWTDLSLKSDNSEENYDEPVKMEDVVVNKEPESLSMCLGRRENSIGTWQHLGSTL